MITPTCSRGHSNPAGAETCGVCGEPLGGATLASEDTSDARSTIPSPPTDPRRVAAVVMIAAALVLAIGGKVAWDRETENVEHDNSVARITGAILEDPFYYSEQEPNRTTPIAMWVIAGLLFLGGVVIYSNTQPALATVAAGSDPAAGDTRACPFCAEEIKRAATVCRYCGREIEPDP